jgi:glutamate-1-semialdehyde 2,1-aminomutase
MSPSSTELFSRALKLIPGGVNSPVRAFRSVGLEPRFIDRGKGSRLFDADGREYIDFVCSWGSLIAGHAHPRVVEAVKQSAELGTSYGACCELEIRMAEALVHMVPSLEKVRMVSSGTEATMSAVRLARAFTGREKIIKFSGCYHGHADSFLSKAGSGVMTCGIPGTQGVTRGAAADTLNAPFNNIDAVKKLIANNPEQIAAVIVEPVAANMGVVLPQEGFLQGLRSLCSGYGIVLIFDEVITGFRLGSGGAQASYQVSPDLTTLGKIIGGGLPAAAFGGKKEIMDMLAPDGPVYQAGTLSGNPLALSAGLATLELVQEPGFYESLAARAGNFFQELQGISRRAGAPAVLNCIFSLGCIFFTDGPVDDDVTAARADTKRYAAYFAAMLDHGIYLAPSQFEAMFISSAHTDEDLARTLHAHRSVLQNLS